MTTYEALRTLDVVIEEVSLGHSKQATSGGFERVTTVVELRGHGATGTGEDVTYETEHHDTLHKRGP